MLNQGVFPKTMLDICFRGPFSFFLGKQKEKETSVNSIKQEKCSKKLPKTTFSAQNSQKTATHIK
jgi:hypothetical protein